MLEPLESLPVDRELYIVKVRLDDETVFGIEAVRIGDPGGLVSSSIWSFTDVQLAIESISRALAMTVQKATTVQKVKPDKTTVKFGLEIGIETGGLTALLAKGSSKANLEITLEWSNSSK
jgi:Trypsin-co-occurring domain 1